MSSKAYPSQTQDRYIVRFPDGMRDQIAEAAKANNRSMNAEIVSRLERSFELTFRPDPALHLRMQLAGHREVAMSTVEVMRRTRDRLLELMERGVEIDPLTERRGRPETVKGRLEKISELLHLYQEQLDLTSELLGEIALSEIERHPLDAKEIIRRIATRNIHVGVAD